MVYKGFIYFIFFKLGLQTKLFKNMYRVWRNEENKIDESNLCDEHEIIEVLVYLYVSVVW